MARYSFLDLVPVRQDGSVAEALTHSLELARHAEQLGFTRYWLAEHHNMDGIASSATAVLIGHIAGGTSRIRVGSGGIMLPNHVPLVVAEQFGTLATLYPDRIDLGLGRAPGTDRATLRALRRSVQERESDFPEQVAELMAYLGPDDGQLRVRAVPGTDTRVPVWLLGSSLFSARLAAQRGLPYAFASHFAPAMLHQALALYRAEFVPSAQLAAPQVIIGAPLLLADSDPHAEYLATSAYQRALALLRGESLRIAPPVERMAGLWSPAEQHAIGNMYATALVGGPQRVKQRLDQLLEVTQADEIIFTCDFYHQHDRHRACELVAELLAD
ncbi:LLM class flavin-dependent oxidoreductase [Isoalcanivorax beigongshangi]|uniref:LLM class flavin-dependent oxidoreductase n=1 Tax=Isoalcanivorax beigongshangi TaxID=3238810 RepID=A0ABV4AFB1_9GAMM